MQEYTESLILNPLSPREIAEIFINNHFRAKGYRSLQCTAHNNQFFKWENGYYQPVPDRRIQAALSEFLQISWKKKKVEGGEEINVPFNPTPSKEREILDSLKSICSGGIQADPFQGPSWIFNIDDDIDDPNLIVPFKNKLLSIDKFINSGESASSLCELTPKYFDCCQIPFDILANDHKRVLPVKFIDFLENVFGGDETAVEFLRQWMGYCLTNSMWMQKILLMVGPPRSGKGTIANVMQEMLGPNNVTNPSANSLTSNFPLEGWINKRLAILGDARFGEKKQAVKEVLLQVSGGDKVNVNIKNKEPVNGVRLPTKIMILSNELPSISDVGGALFSRFMVLKMEKSFLGKEDPDLFERDLKPEIPRIFWWALDGLKTLKAQKTLIQAKGSQDMVDELKRIQSPVKAFVDDFCNVHPDLSIETKTLHAAYVRWCDEEGVKSLNDVHFSIQLTCAYNTISRKRKGADSTRILVGISLKDRS